MNKQDFLASGLLEQYVLGLTTPEEAQEVEAHLEAFPELQEELFAMQEALEDYAALHAIPPAPGKRRAPASGGKTPVQSENFPRWIRLLVWFFPWFMFLSVVTLGVMGSWLWRHNTQLKAQLASRDAEIAQWLHRCHTQHFEQQALALLIHPDTRVIRLSPVDVAQPDQQLGAIAYWNPTAGKVYFNPSSLPDPPEDHQFQVWADIDGRMVSMGLLPRQTHQLVALHFHPRAASINVTLEPSGGQDHPTLTRLVCAGGV